MLLFQFALPKESEVELAGCLVVRANWGYGCTSDEIKDLVRQYVDMKKGDGTPIGDHLQKHCHFSTPGKDWLTYFMRRYELSLKKPSALEKTRKIAASSPNTIYGYYDMVYNEAKKLDILHRPECFWNQFYF